MPSIALRPASPPAGRTERQDAMLDRLTQSLDFHGQALVLRSQRQQMIASNIANADTPNYVARDMDFAAALRDAAGLGGTAARLSAPKAGHLNAAGMATGGPADANTSAAVQAAQRYATPAQTNLDRNTVDMDRERAAFADNAVQYEATLRFINGNVKTMLSAITGQ
jgi:flagellar basal-body rod protein FlgB